MNKKTSGHHKKDRRRPVGRLEFSPHLVKEPISPPIFYFPFRVLVILGIILLFGLQVLGPRLVETPLSSILTKLEKEPTHPQAHIDLSRYFFSIKDITKANQELQLAQETSKNKPSVLGAQSDSQNLEKDIEQYENSYSAQQFYWQNMVNTYPTYTDGWVQLLYLAYERSNTKMAQQYLDKIYSLDPLLAKSLQETLTFPIVEKTSMTR